MGSRANTHAAAGRQIKRHSWRWAPKRWPAAVGRAGPACAEALERRVLLTATWDGSVSNLWSEPGNWEEGVAPTDGEDLVFPANAANKTSTNDLGVIDIDTITIRGSGWTINSTARQRRPTQRQQRPDHHPSPDRRHQHVQRRGRDHRAGREHQRRRPVHAELRLRADRQRLDHQGRHRHAGHVGGQSRLRRLDHPRDRDAPGRAPRRAGLPIRRHQHRATSPRSSWRRARPAATRSYTSATASSAPRARSPGTA